MNGSRFGAFGPVAPISRDDIEITLATRISRADIESALRARGYQKGAYRELVTPQYTRQQSITMGVDEALSSIGFPTKPAMRMTLEPVKWETLVAGAQVNATKIAQRVQKKRKLVGLAGREV